MKFVRIILRILMCLLLLVPVLGIAGVFPEPTADLYTPSGWAFMQALMAAPYLMPTIGVLCAVCVVLFAMGRTALAAILITPLTVNVIGFHATVDTGLIHPSATLGILLALLNLFFLWDNRRKYRGLLRD